MSNARRQSRFARRALAPVGAALALALACAPVAAAAGGFEGSGALSELTRGGNETQTQTQTTPNGSTTETGSSKGTIVIALVAGGVLLSGIAFVIVRDARRVAPAGDEDLFERRPGRDQSVALAKRRAKAKAARRQRKRNR